MIIGTCEWRRKEFIRMWSVVMRDHAWCGDVLYLVGPWTIGLCTTHNNQSDHCTTVEDPSSETEEINQRINGAIENHSSGNNWLLADTICQSLEINVAYGQIFCGPRERCLRGKWAQERVSNDGHAHTTEYRANVLRDLLQSTIVQRRIVCRWHCQMC